MKKVSFLLLICMAALITQCKKESPHVWNNTNGSPGGGTGGGQGTSYPISKGASIKIDAFGIILDEQGIPLSGVQVTLGSTVYTSNDLGQVKIEQGSAFKEIAFFKAQKAGFFPGSRTLIPIQGVNQFEIRLISKGTPQVFQADQGAILNDGGLQVEVGEGLVDASGNEYKGTVNAYVRHLSPDDPNILSIMPGALRGGDANGEKVLETYGMLTIELEGTGGEKLQLGNSNPATIISQVPSSMLADAPSTIPLWHFDEDAGIWMHDGEAKLVNGAYVGTVSHFSTWNYDIPNSPGRLYGKVIGADGISIAGIYVDFRRKDSRHSGGMVNEDGSFIAQLPLNTDLDMYVLFRGVAIHHEIVNLGNSTTMNKEIRIPAISLAKIYGTVMGCNGSPVVSGYVIASNYVAARIENGRYEFNTWVTQGKSLELTAIYLNGLVSQKRTVILDKAQIEVPSFGLCPNNGSTTDFEFSFQLEGKNIAIEGVKAVFDSDSITIFYGGKQALDYSTDHAFRAGFYNYGEWSNKSQFKIGETPGTWNGMIDFELGDGKKYYAKDVDVTVSSKSPYSIQFSGIFKYYDSNTSQNIDVQVSNGKIVEN